MAETEVPEAKNPFEKRVAITIALIAVLMTFNENRNDNAKTDAILRSIEASEKTTEAANQWAYFQAKSIKEHTYDVQRETLPATAAAADQALREKMVADFAAKTKKYEKEKEEIKEHAEAKEAEATALRSIAKQNIAVNECCDHAALPLQIAVILCSVAIVAGIHFFWWAGIIAALIGGGMMAASFRIKVDEPAEEPAAAVAPAAHPAAAPAEPAAKPER